MTKEDVKAAMIEALKEHHPCIFSEADRSILNDMIAVGNGAKKVFIGAIVFVVTLAAAAAIVLFVGKIPSIAG